MRHYHPTVLCLGVVVAMYSVVVGTRTLSSVGVYDAVQVLYLLKHSIAAGTVPLHGIVNSQMLYNPPFFVWYYYIPAWFTSDPSLIFVIPNLIAQITTLLLLYRIGRDYFRPTTGVVAATLYAFSPLGIEFGRLGWAYAHTAPLYVAIVFCLFRWLISRQTSYIIPLIVLCGWITGVHLAGALTFFVVGSAALAWRTLPPLRPTLIGIGLLVLVWTPFLVFQYQRGFVDIIGLVQTRSDVPDPTALSPLCPPDWNAAMPHASLMKGLSLEKFSLSLFLTGHVNFYVRGAWTTYERIVTLMLMPLFWVALYFLIRRTLRRSATPAEQLLLLVVAAPVILQNLTPFNTVERRDITWTILGVQMLLLGYTLTIPQWMRARPIQLAVLLGLSLMIGYQSYLAGHNIHAWLRGDLYDGRQEVADVIAADAHQRGVQQPSIRYDLLLDEPTRCWIVGMSTIVDTGYVGAEFDYYLQYMHALPITGRSPDGWVDTPDYIVTPTTWPRATYYAADPERYVPLATRPPYMVWHYQP